MPLSSLQAQLAAIQDGGKYKTSIKHDQAVGRGAQFSVQTGARRPASHRFQPSLLYETASEAADVPLSTLQTQFEEAVLVLGEAEPELLDRTDRLLRTEAAADETSSPTFQKTIRTTLYLIASLLASTSDDDPERFRLPARYILEYLLRKFQLHVDFPIDLFWSCWLSNDDQLLQRCWELIDWGQVTAQSYATSLRFGCGTVAVRRCVGQHVDVMRTIVTWTQLVATTAVDPARVVAQSAALILPAIRGQKEMGSAASATFVASEEQQTALLRTLLPVLQFRGHNDDFVHWSFCVASALVEAVDVSQLVLDDLCSRMLVATMDDEDEDASRRTTAVTCVLSLLLVPRSNDMTQSQSLLLPVGNEYWIGCTALSDTIYQRLILDPYWWDVVETLHTSLVFTPVLMTAICRAVQHRDMATIEKVVGLFVLGLEKGVGKSSLVCDALLAYLEQNAVDEPSLLDILRPHCGSSVQLQKPALLLNDSTSALLYVEQSVKESAVDWKLLASHIHQIAPQHAVRLAIAIVEAATHASSTTATKETVVVVAHFAPHHTCATACLWSWTTETNKNMKRVRKAAEKALCDIRLRDSIVAATAHVDSAAVPVLKAVAKAEWQDDDDLVNCVTAFCLKILPALDTIPGVQSPTTKTLKGLLNTVLRQRKAEEQHEWIVTLASSIPSKPLWETLASDVLPTVGVQGILTACNLPSASPSSVDRLLSLLVGDEALETAEASAVLLPTLCFLASNHAGVRSAAAQVVSKLSPPSSRRSSTILASIRDAIAESIGAAQLGGMTYLSTLLAKACKTNKNKEQLLSMCVEHAGTARTARTILEACEMAGEDAFPLVVRWDHAGQPILRSLLKKKDESSSEEDEGLLLTLSRLLKGVTVADPTKVGIVSSGKGGGRVRSYSVGNSSGIQLVSSYPSSMTQAIETILKGSNSKLATVLLDYVLSSQSWQNLFQGLTKERKGSLTRSLVDHICRESDSMAESTLMSFPLTCEDLVGLLKGKHELGPLSVVVDFVRDNAGSLMREAENSALYSQLFRILETLTNKGSLDVENEFVVQSVLAGVKKLLDNCPAERRVEFKKKELDQWLQSLLVILEAKQVPEAIKTFAVSVFTSLCPRSPEEVTPFLIRASVASVDPAPSGASDNFSLHSFTKLMLTYSKFAETASLSLTDLFVPWLAPWTSAVERSRQEELVSSVAKFSSRSNDGCLRDNLFCIVAIYLASSASDENVEEAPAVAFVVDLVASLPQYLQMETLLVIIDYVMGLISIFRDGTAATDSVAAIKTTSMDLARVAVEGLAPPTKKRKKSTPPTKLKGNMHILRLCTALLTCFGDSLLLDDVQWCVEKGKKDLTKLTLRLWQDLLVLESATRSSVSVGNSSTSPIINLVTECKEQLQRLLPADLFLASTTTLICDGDTKEMKSKALRLVAEKALNFNVESPERILFLDVVPIVVQTVRDLPTIENWTEEDSVLLQTALVALEHITRTFVQNVKGGMPAETLQGFLDALQLCNNVVACCTSDKAVMGHLEGALSCAALCASSLIRSLGPLCLSELPKLMTSLIASLQRNVSLDNPSETKDVVRLSILRPITSVLESMPQFSTPFLPKLLHSQAALSPFLRGGTVSELLQEAVHAFDTALGDSVEPRILIPAASRAATEEDAPESIVVLFRILTASVSQATPACVASNRSNIVKSIFHAFDQKCDEDKSRVLLEAACDVIDTTILKLSEVQLRKLYSSLREWRGDFDASDPEKTSRNRFAFWTVTARLCKTLRMIFLPCLVLEDLTTELALAVNNLCKSNSDPVNKKRKITRNYGAGSFQVLAPLLSSLESALRSDAHQGGTWIRDDEGRYEDIMEPLTKLLHCRVGEELSSSVTFEHVVHQAADGNVVSTLVALASAVGDEHSWKPMNHAVLQACSDDRAEVRQAGLLCLMQFMKALGEEYMTLLPENLPVLSDLLEDPNEEVALLTKEVIALSEEITGENLEENLR